MNIVVTEIMIQINGVLWENEVDAMCAEKWQAGLICFLYGVSSYRTI